VFASVVTALKFLNDDITITNPLVISAIVCFIGFFLMELFYGDLLHAT